MFTHSFFFGLSLDQGYTVNDCGLEALAGVNLSPCVALALTGFKITCATAVGLGALLAEGCLIVGLGDGAVSGKLGLFEISFRRKLNVCSGSISLRLLSTEGCVGFRRRSSSYLARRAFARLWRVSAVYREIMAPWHNVVYKGSYRGSWCSRN